MIPIQDLLSRIRWDKTFGTGNFQIGYYDRFENTIHTIPFSRIRFRQGDHFSFQIENELGEWVSIPLHRVRQVLKDGELIWERV